MYRDETPKIPSLDWIRILEEHFRERRKAFLVFDKDHVLIHTSDYAREILEISGTQAGIMNARDLFPSDQKTPQLLMNHKYPHQKIHDITYTTPSGKLVDIRLNIDQKPGSEGYMLWLEPKYRDITGTFRKVSSLEPYKDFNDIFTEFDIGFMLINRDGIIIDYNDQIKHMFRLPGEWKGQNIFTYPPLQENKFSRFIRRCISGRKKTDAKSFKVKYSSKAESLVIKLSVMKLTDQTGNATGALITCRGEI